MVVIDGSHVASLIPRAHAHGVKWVPRYAGIIIGPFEHLIQFENKLGQSYYSVIII